MAMPPPSVVSSPRRLRPRPPAATSQDVDPTSDTLGYAGTEEARIALEKQAEEEANMQPATKRLARGLRDGIRKVPRAKSILKYPRGPIPPPGFSTTQGYPSDPTFMDQSFAGPSRTIDYHSTPYRSPERTLQPVPLAPSQQAHGDNWEGTTASSHEPPAHVTRSRPAVIDMDGTTALQKPLTEDYKRMPVEFYEPPLFSFTRIKDFILTIHKLPWIAEDRITVDYYPGRGTRISTGLTDMSSQSGDDVLSSPSFSLRPRRRPISSWFLGGSSRTQKGGREGLDLAASPEHAYIGSPGGARTMTGMSTAHASPNAPTHDFIMRQSPAHSRARSADAMTPLMPIVQQIVPSPPPGIAVQSPTATESTSTTFDSSTHTPSTSTTQHTIRLVQPQPMQSPNAGQQYWIPPALRDAAGQGPVIPSGTFTGRSLDSTESSIDADFTQSTIDPRNILQIATRAAGASVDPSANMYVQGGGGVGIYRPSTSQAVDTRRKHRSDSSSPIRSPPRTSGDQHSPRHRYTPEPQAVYTTSRQRAGGREDFTSMSPVLPSVGASSMGHVAGISRDRPEGDFKLMNSPQPPYVPLQFSSIDGMHARDPVRGEGYIDR